MAVTATQLQQRMRDEPSLRVLDVRTPAEYEDMHIEGTHLQPLDELNAADMARQCAEGLRFVILCQKGGRSEKAAQHLCDAGCGEVEVLEGGIVAWERAGLPVVHGRRMMSLERQVRIGAGSLVLVGVLLGLLIHPGFYGISAFVGAGLVFAGVTDTCGMAMVLTRMPWNQRKYSTPGKSGIGRESGPDGRTSAGSGA